MGMETAMIPDSRRLVERPTTLSFGFDIVIRVALATFVHQSDLQALQMLGRTLHLVESILPVSVSCRLVNGQ